MNPNPIKNSEPASREELIARVEELGELANTLNNRINKIHRPSPSKVIPRDLLLFGLPVLVGTGVYLGTASILWTLLAVAGLLVTIFTIIVRQTPVAPGPGTVAFEARMNANLLKQVIASKRQEQASADGERRQFLSREIAFLGGQLEENLKVATSGDRSLGSGSIGFQPYKEKETSVEADASTPVRVACCLSFTHRSLDDIVEHLRGDEKLAGLVFVKNGQALFIAGKGYEVCVRYFEKPEDIIRETSKLSCMKDRADRDAILLVVESTLADEFAEQTYAPFSPLGTRATSGNIPWQALVLCERLNLLPDLQVFDLALKSFYPKGGILSYGG